MMRKLLHNHSIKSKFESEWMGFLKMNVKKVYIFVKKDEEAPNNC